MLVATCCPRTTFHCSEKDRTWWRKVLAGAGTGAARASEDRDVPRRRHSRGQSGGVRQGVADKFFAVAGARRADGVGKQAGCAPIGRRQTKVRGVSTSAGWRPQASGRLNGTLPDATCASHCPPYPRRVHTVQWGMYLPDGSARTSFSAEV